MSRALMNHKVLGVVFVGLLVLGVWTVNAVFTQKFVDFERVTLTTDTAGLNLPERADVKIRGVLVGQVNEVVTDADKATLELGIRPGEIEQIPANVTASILPKTLFGEKYVELAIPENPSSESLAAGDSIKRTDLPVEVEKVLNDLYPLLRTVQPAELNYTLNALAGALEGRGEKIGENFVTLDSYLKRMNPQLPALIEDIKLLADVTDTYADVTPQIAATLRNTVKTGNTLISKEEKLNAFLQDMTAFSDTTKAFLDANGNNIIRLGRLSEPILALLARYSPEFPCLLKGIVRQIPRLSDTFRGFIFHINLKILPRQPRGYTGADRQVYGATNGPSCAGLPNPPIPYPSFPNLADGVNDPSLGKNGRPGTGFASTGEASSTGTPGTPRAGASPTAAPASEMSVGPSGTASQKALINSLTAPAMGIPVGSVPDVNALLFAPAMAGTEVSVG